MDKDIRTLRDLIIRVGDQGPSYYRLNIQKLADTISKDLEAEDFRQQLNDTIIIAISKIPNKFFVYAIIVSYISQTQTEFAEKLFIQLCDHLQTYLQNNQILEASNIICFFAETVNTGLMNSFTFISLLMELITASEKDMDNFETLTKLILKSVLYVKAHMVEKYEMEYANLIEDIKKNIDKFIKEGKTFELSYFAMLIEPLADINIKPTFRLYADDCKDFIKNVKPIRQNIKLNFSITGPKNRLFMLPELIIFDQEFADIRSQSRPAILNEFLVREYIKDNLIAFSSNNVLFIEKVFAINLGSHDVIKNFAFIELCYSILLHPEMFSTNQTFAIILEILIKYFNFEIFFENSLTKFSRFISNTIDRLSIVQIETIINNLALVNYLTSKNFSLQLDGRNAVEKISYFDFFHSYKTLKQSLANQTNPINKADLNK